MCSHDKRTICINVQASCTNLELVSRFIQEELEQSEVEVSLSPLSTPIEVDQIWLDGMGRQVKITCPDSTNMLKGELVGPDHLGWNYYNQDGYCLPINIMSKYNLVQLLPPAEPIEPKPGEYWMDRDGDVWLVKKDSSFNNTFPLCAHGNSNLTWTRTGKYLHDDTHQYDLVSRVYISTVPLEEDKA